MSREIIANTPHKAFHVEYRATVLDRTLGERYRLRRLSEALLSFADTLEIHLVAHSNGADVALDALAEVRRTIDIRVVRITLLAPAISADCDKSKLNTCGALEVVIHRASRDLPLQFAGLPIGRVFGFGDLGAAGVVPRNQKIDLSFHDWEGGHETFFESRENFRALMGYVLK